MQGFQTPVLFVIFNRLSTAEKVFEAIRRLKPAKLYIAADGPRKGNEFDKENCPKVRKIVDRVDWDCELKTLFRDENLGCGKSVSGAIDWMFENEDRGIVLEDDCLPNEDFFFYCDELLQRYKDNPQIMAICGNNSNTRPSAADVSYWYSSILHVWGWATWARAWKTYEYDLNKYSLKQLRQFYKPYSVGFESELYWLYRALQMKKRKADDIWDYQAEFWIWRNHGLSIQPSVPLVTNIGVECEQQTHVFKNTDDYVLQTRPILPLNYNDTIVQDKKADLSHHKKYHRKPLWKYPLLYLLIILGLR